jgi:hypothetical protein
MNVGPQFEGYRATWNAGFQRQVIPSSDNTPNTATFMGDQFRFPITAVGIGRSCSKSCPNGPLKLGYRDLWVAGSNPAEASAS